MEHTILTHNYLRWLVLLAGLFAVIQAWRGRGSGTWTKLDKIAGGVFVGVMDLQFLIGILLWFISPWRSVAFSNLMGDGGYFGILHPILMITAIATAHVGKVKVKKAAETARHALALKFYGIALVLVVVAIPWWRPLFPTP